MPPDNFDLIGSPILIEVIRYLLLVILILYALFSLLIVRQVDLMSKTLITPLSPIVKAGSIVHAGFAIGFVVLGIGLL